MAKKRKSSVEAPSDQRLGPLIDGLGPINNACRSADGIDKVELLWDLGDALLQHDAHAADALLRTVAERSYITRDLLRYGLIIRRGWAERNELRRTFSSVSHFSLFREALPFLKADRCGISDEEHARIVAMLNGTDAKAAREFLLSLKKKKIGRQHKKGQAVAKMADVANAVRGSIRRLFDLVSADKDKVEDCRKRVGPDYLLCLAQWCMALAEDNSVPQCDPVNSNWPELLADLATNLEIVSKARREDRAGFRRALGPLTLMEAADLINAMRSDEQVDDWMRRRRINLVV